MPVRQRVRGDLGATCTAPCFELDLARLRRYRTDQGERGGEYGCNQSEARLHRSFSAWKKAVRRALFDGSPELRDASGALGWDEEADRMTCINPRLMGAPMVFPVGRVLDALVSVADHLAGGLDDISLRHLEDRGGPDLLAIHVATARPRVLPPGRGFVCVGWTRVT